MLNFVKSIFRFLWRLVSWLRIAILNLVFLAILITFIQAIRTAPSIEIPNQSALFVAPSGSLVDQSTYNPTLIELLAQPQDLPQETDIHELIKAIKHARDDDEITGIIMRLDYMTAAGMSKIEEVGQALNYFKESGKRVLAYADSMNQQQYLLASYADEIYINSMGSVYLTGFGVYQNYFKSAAEKIALKFHVFRVGDYKDAIEPFIRDDMSDSSKEHISSWLNALWGRYTATIENHRKLERGELDRLIAELDKSLIEIEGNSASYAVDQGLVDATYSRLELKDRLIEEFGQDGNNNIKAISVSSYLNNPLIAKNESEEKIGLIIATGNILGGYQAENAIGAASLSELIERAREDEDLSALVIRIDSGGGSAFASEVIRDQLRLTNESGLPVYISMGSMAASGGYWISIAGTEIWSTPTTLTGSIGVFGLIPNLSQSLGKLGIYSDGVGTSDLSDAFQIDRELSPRAKTIIQSGVDNIYRQFISLVADARGTSTEEIHEIAQGRVWSGSKAQELGLVDKLGTLQDVLASAAQDQGLENFSVKKITRERSPMEQLIHTLSEQASFDFAIIDEKPGLANFITLFTENTTVLSDASLLMETPNELAPNLVTYARCIECVAP